MSKRNYGAGNSGTMLTSILKLLLNWQVLLALAVAVPLFFIGISGVFGIFKLVTSPIASGSIPVWSIFMLGLVIILVRRRRTY